MAATCTPGVFGTWARYIAPNLPAPIKPTRQRPALRGALAEFGVEATATPDSQATDSARKADGRRAVAPRQRHFIIAKQAVVGQALERREIAVRDVLRALESAGCGSTPRTGSGRR